MVTPEGRFKADFRQELKKLGFTAVLQYKQDATTVQGFPGISFCGSMCYNGGMLC